MIYMLFATQPMRGLRRRQYQPILECRVPYPVCLCVGVCVFMFVCVCLCVCVSVYDFLVPVLCHSSSYLLADFTEFASFLVYKNHYRRHF